MEGSSGVSRLRVNCLVLALLVDLFVAGAQAKPPVQVKRVRVSSYHGYARVVVDLDGSVIYRIRRLTAPERLYVDLVSTTIAPPLKSGRIPVNVARLKQIRVGNNQGAVTRLALDLRSEVTLKAFQLSRPPRLVLDLKPPTAARAIAREIGRAHV